MDGLKAVQGSLRKARASTIYQHIEKKLSDVDTVLSGRIGLLQLFNDFVSALGQVRQSACTDTAMGVGYLDYQGFQDFSTLIVLNPFENWVFQNKSLRNLLFLHRLQLSCTILDSAIKEEMEEKTAKLLQKQLSFSVCINLQHAKTAGEKLASEMNHSRKLVSCLQGSQICLPRAQDDGADT